MATKAIVKINPKPIVNAKAVLRLKLLDMIKDNTFSQKKIIKKDDTKEKSK